jgi:hypothetical protein
MSIANVIALPELGSDCAGAIVFWRLGGAVVHVDLVAAWTARGLDADLLPSPPTPTAALRRAVRTFEGDHKFARRIEGQEAFVLVAESYGEDGRPVYANGCELGLQLSDAHTDENGKPTLQPFVRGADTIHEIVNLERTYRHHLARLKPQSVGGWLVDLAHRVHAVSLRDTGGVYFIPRHTLDTWRSYVDAVRAVSAVKLFEIPSLRSEDAIEAIVDALKSEVNDVANTITDDLDRMVDEVADSGGSPSRRALTTRLERAQRVETKIAAYENTLGIKLDELRTQFERLQMRVGTAIMSLGSE